MIVDREYMATALPGYDIGDELGRGGWGVVVEGCHRQLQRDVAIKQLPRAFGADTAIRARFLAEARMLASFDHPHIVPVYDFVEHEGLCLLVMEKLTGGTVWDRFKKGGMTAENACAVALTTCAALHYAHKRGVLHRDIKPENLLLSAAGTLKVSDFGIAAVLGGAGPAVTRAGEVVGTPAYMAPEQALGKAVSPATDVYAAGTMLYELLSGQLPFPDEDEPLSVLYRHVNEEPRPIRETAPALPHGIGDVVMRALARTTDDRFPSAEAFGAALVRAANSAWGVAWLGRCEFPIHAASTMLGGTDAEQAAGDTSTTDGLQASGERRFPQRSLGAHARGTSLVGVEHADLLSAEDAARAIQASVASFGAVEVSPDGDAPSAKRRRTGMAIATVVAIGLVVAVLGVRALAPGKARTSALPSTPSTRPVGPSPVVGKALEWRGLSGASVARQQVAVVADQGTIWVLGGLSGNSSTAKVEGYDPAIDTWKAGPDLPVPVHHAMGVAYKGQLVVLGGWIPAGSNLTAIASDRVFALRAGTWVDLPPLNRPRAAGAAVVADGKIVVMGGQADGKLVPATEVFDGGGWRDVADLPTPRDHMAAATDGRMVYAVGGRARSADKNLAALESFDPVTEQWHRLPDMPTARGGLGAAVVGRQLVALGGENPVGVFDKVEAFDLDRGTWTALSPMLTPRHGMGVVSIGSSIYAIDGSHSPTHSEASPTAEVLDLP